MPRKYTQSPDRADIYSDITNKIIADIETGVLPWVQPWGSYGVGLGLPINASTRRRYSGINILILWSAVIQRNFSHHTWLTFKQAQGLGGVVRKGERGTTVVYADHYTPQAERQRAYEADEDAHTISFLKRFTVFNVSQCDGLTDMEADAIEPLSEELIDPRVQALIKASCIDFRIGGERAYYVPSADFVQVPPPQAYFEAINWHRTALHELSHSTGHVTRLNRDLSGTYGSSAYAFEELVAEISSAFCCASLGIIPTVRHADYLATWLKLLHDDKRAIVRAASQASKAADYLLQYVPLLYDNGAESTAQNALPVAAE